MTITAQRACSQIVVFIREHGGAYSQWYCGVAADWEDRLFNGHRLPDRSYRWWIVTDACIDNPAARLAEDAVHSLGCDGGPSRDDEGTVYVYAYLKGSFTDP